MQIYDTIDGDGDPKEIGLKVPGGAKDLTYLDVLDGDRILQELKVRYDRNSYYVRIYSGLTNWRIVENSYDKRR